jgi:hypothetical protein
MCNMMFASFWQTNTLQKPVAQFLCWLIQVPTINQENAIPGTEPTETLLTFRSDEVLRPSHKNKRKVIVFCTYYPQYLMTQLLVELYFFASVHFLENCSVVASKCPVHNHVGH